MLGRMMLGQIARTRSHEQRSAPGRRAVAWAWAVGCGLALAAGCSASSDENGSSSSSSGSQSSGTSSGQGGSFGSGGSGSFNGEQCGKSTFGNQVPGSLLLILDRSGSMNDDGGFKWSGTVAAINQMVNGADPATEIGLLAYPAGNFDSTGLIGCLPPLGDPAAGNCPAILADGGCTDVNNTPDVGINPVQQSGGPISSWLSQNGPDGNTPTLHALRNGYKILKGYSATGQLYALLITDGEPTLYTPAMNVGGLMLPEMNLACGEQADIENEVLAASNGTPGVSTFVIGSPGSEPAAPFLSQLAVHGNTGKTGCNVGAGDCHFQVGTGNFQQDLQSALDQISGVISDCIFDLPQGDDVDPNFINVKVEGASGDVEILKDPSHQDGWDYTDGTQTKIQLYGPACNQYKDQKGNTITIILGCETVLK
jgi:hypothetical protein